MSTDDRLRVLRFAACFLWADLEIDPRERAFFVDLARELGVPDDAVDEIAAILESPPTGDAIDPTHVPLDLAPTVRDVALRAIASDGRIEPAEMALFDLLDELLPSPLPPVEPQSPL